MMWLFLIVLVICITLIILASIFMAALKESMSDDNKGPQRSIPSLPDGNDATVTIRSPGTHESPYESRLTYGSQN